MPDHVGQIPEVDVQPVKVEHAPMSIGMKLLSRLEQGSLPAGQCPECSGRWGYEIHPVLAMVCLNQNCACTDPKVDHRDVVEWRQVLRAYTSELMS